MLSSNHNEIEKLIPAYALGALSPAEQAAVQRHLAGCAGCRALLAEYQRVAEDLLYTPPLVTAPTHLEADLIRRLEEEDSQDVYLSPPRWRTWLASLFSPPARPAMAMAILLLVALVASNVYWVSITNHLQAEQVILAQQREAQRLAIRVLAAGGRTVVLHGDAPAPEAVGTLILARDQPEAVLIVDGLPPLPAGMVYQLWLIRDGQRDNGGLFGIDAGGHGVLMVQASHPLTNYQAVGVTVEPAGGSPGPTSPRVIGAPLS